MLRLLLEDDDVCRFRRDDATLAKCPPIVFVASNGEGGTVRSEKRVLVVRCVCAVCGVDGRGGVLRAVSPADGIGLSERLGDMLATLLMRESDVISESNTPKMSQTRNTGNLDYVVAEERSLINRSVEHTSHTSNIYIRMS